MILDKSPDELETLRSKITSRYRREPSAVTWRELYRVVSELKRRRKKPTLETMAGRFRRLASPAEGKLGDKRLGDIYTMPDNAKILRGGGTGAAGRHSRRSKGGRRRQ